MRSMGIKDLKTVMHMIEDKASGKPQDDRKMHMEEIMQVSNARIARESPWRLSRDNRTTTQLTATACWGASN
jgi:hypothetical protein